ncbi:MAG: hypothetical protein BWX88_04438 [Planctomycetes bacterium ADurb.Bin126]|nr:MAG: hypothetical protein BWX88_04438 [Planctomycetes bacterium ADurb.Bin126]HOD82849.1 hypothetical protein [Phycisphaerae bacterium]
MSIPIYCTGCKKDYQAPDRCAGKKIQCKTCGTLITVPAAPTPASQAPIMPDVVEERPPHHAVAPHPSGSGHAAHPSHASHPPHHHHHAGHHHHKKTSVPAVVILVVILGLAAGAGIVTYVMLPKPKPVADPGLALSTPDKTPPPAPPQAAPTPPKVQAVPATAPATAPAGPASGAGSAPPAVAVAADSAALLELPPNELPRLPLTCCAAVAPSAPDSPYLLVITRANLSDEDPHGERRLAVYDLKADRTIRSVQVRELVGPCGRVSSDALQYAYVGAKNGKAGVLVQSLESDLHVKVLPQADVKWFDFAGARLVAYSPASNALTLWDYQAEQGKPLPAPPAQDQLAAGAVSPGGRLLALAAQARAGEAGKSLAVVHLYDLASAAPAGTLTATVDEGKAIIEDVAFSPEGKHLAAYVRADQGQADSAMRIVCWDLADSKLVHSTAIGRRAPVSSPCRPALQFMARGSGYVVQGRYVFQAAQSEPSRVLEPKGDLALPRYSKVLGGGLILNVWIDPGKPFDGATISFGELYNPK